MTAWVPVLAVLNFTFIYWWLNVRQINAERRRFDAEMAKLDEGDR